MAPSSPDAPPSDELDALHGSVTDGTAFSDDFAALQDIQHDAKLARSSKAVQHRIGKTADVFRSEPREPTTSSPLHLSLIHI